MLLRFDARMISNYIIENLSLSAVGLKEGEGRDLKGEVPDVFGKMRFAMNQKSPRHRSRRAPCVR